MGWDGGRGRAGAYLDLKLHHVAASGGPNQARADVLVVLVKRPDVPGVLVVVDDLTPARASRLT